MKKCINGLCIAFIVLVTPITSFSQATTFIGNQLAPGESLKSGEGLKPDKGGAAYYKLVMQTDGNLVIYNGSKPKWSSRTKGDCSGCRLTLQTDGNLVLYSQSGNAEWTSKTASSSNSAYAQREWKPAKLVFENDGSLVLYSATNNIVWTSVEGRLPTVDNSTVTQRGSSWNNSNSSSFKSILLAGETLYTNDELRNGSYRAVVQEDGNFVIYDNTTFRWHANTPNRNRSKLVLQQDGNLVVYNQYDQSLWSSQTQANWDRKYNTREWKPVRLELTKDGKLALFTETGSCVWTSTDGKVSSLLSSRVSGSTSFPRESVLDINQTLYSNQELTVPSAGGLAVRAVMQSDGNFVIYRGSSPRWSTRTKGDCSGCRVVLQSDGNLILYSSSGSSEWSSKTVKGHNAVYGTRDWKPTKLVLEPDATLALYSVTGNKVWSSAAGRIYPPTETSSASSTSSSTTTNNTSNYLGSAATFSNSNYYRITNNLIGEGKALDGTSDLLMDKTGFYPGQYWKLTPVDGGYYQISTQLHGIGKSMDATSDIKLDKTGFNSGQYWKIVSAGDGLYKISTKSKGENYVLEMFERGLNNYGVRLVPFNGYNGQYWKLTSINN